MDWNSKQQTLFCPFLGFSWCTSSTKTIQSIQARRLTCGTCTSEDVGTFSQLEIASGSNTRANSRVAEEDNQNTSVQFAGNWPPNKEINKCETKHFEIESPPLQTFYSSLINNAYLPRCLTSLYVIAVTPPNCLPNKLHAKSNQPRNPIKSFFLQPVH